MNEEDWSTLQRQLQSASSSFIILVRSCIGSHADDLYIAAQKLNAEMLQNVMESYKLGYLAGQNHPLRSGGDSACFFSISTLERGLIALVVRTLRHPWTGISSFESCW